MKKGKHSIKVMAGTAKPGSFFTAYPKKIKPNAFSMNGKQVSRDSMELARAGVGLAFAGLALGVGLRAFRNAFD